MAERAARACNVLKGTVSQHTHPQLSLRPLGLSSQRPGSTSCLTASLRTGDWEEDWTAQSRFQSTQQTFMEDRLGVPSSSQGPGDSYLLIRPPTKRQALF